MEQGTGGHYLDTGDGPVLVSPATLRERAWDDYQAHRRACAQCRASVWRCATGNELWNEWTGATS
jgi:hypothetical protein